MARSKVFRRYVRGALSLAALALCVCDKVPEYCGDGQSSFDFRNQRCVDGTAYSKCGGDWYNPKTHNCNGGRVELIAPDTTPITTPATYTLTVDKDPPAGGNAVIAENNQTTQSNISAGTPVNITATANGGYTFNSWTITSGSGAIADTNDASTSVTVNGDVTVMANFTQNFIGGNDGQYDYVELGGLKWMRKNLNVVVVGNSWCYDNSADSCAKYGRLYTWEAAKTVCQSIGWRLPTREDWDALAAAVGGRDGAGMELKSTSGWYENGNGNDTYGFSALPGGRRNTDNFDNIDRSEFESAGYWGYWWSATGSCSGCAPFGLDYAYGRSMVHGNVNEENLLEGNGFSVRCVKDDGNTTYTLTVDKDPPAGGNAVIAGNNQTTQSNISAGTQVNITATANGWYSFNNWTISGIGTIADANKASTSVTVNGNATVRANFTNYVDPSTVINGTFTYDGQIYKTVTIGGQTWMAENLNVSTADSWCYDEYTDNCNTYGRLYTWSAAKSACQPLGGGWRLPDTADWRRLVGAAGGYSVDTAGSVLKSTSGWWYGNGGNGGNGTDTYGFSALPAGRRITDGSFSSIGRNGHWWTATAFGDARAYGRYISSDYDFVNESSYDIGIGMSVRCVRDENSPPPTTYAVTVSSAGTGATGSGNYAASATVVIFAGTAPAGHVFSNWTSSSNSVIFANANNATTTFTMPGNAVTVTAVFGVTPPNNCGKDGTANSCKTTVIGGKVWMAENLNYQTGNSWCYNDSNSYCNKYGRLYTWEAAKAACESVGWRLPDTAEWNALVTAAGGSSVAGKKLKATSGWGNNSSYNGTDDFGFSALPGLARHSGSGFYDADGHGYWWTATEYNGDYAYFRYMLYDSNDVYEFYDCKSCGRSVRCVQDE